MENKNSYWNYRIIKIADKKLKNIDQTYSYGIYEIYYTDDKLTSWSADPVYPIGESFNELYEDYHYMFQAFTKKVLELKDGKLIEGKLMK